MAKKTYKATQKIFNIKNHQVFIEKKDDIIYISEGHVIFSFSHTFYNTFFLGKSTCFPILSDENASYTIQDGSIQKKNDTIFSDTLNNMKNKDMYTCKLSPLMVDTDKGIISTCFYHDNDRRVQAVALNKKFIDGLMEFLPSRDTPLKVASPKEPVCYFDDYFSVMILPIWIDTCPDLKELVISMNAEIELKQMKSMMA